MRSCKALLQNHGCLALRWRYQNALSPCPPALEVPPCIPCCRSAWLSRSPISIRCPVFRPPASCFLFPLSISLLLHLSRTKIDASTDMLTKEQPNSVLDRLGDGLHVSKHLTLSIRSGKLRKTAYREAIEAVQPGGQSQGAAPHGQDLRQSHEHSAESPRGREVWTVLETALQQVLPQPGLTLKACQWIRQPFNKTHKYHVHKPSSNTQP